MNPSRQEQVTKEKQREGQFMHRDHAGNKKKNSSSHYLIPLCTQTVSQG